ncbi:MAG: N-acetyltransferase family protein [Candidatus Eisenbacteria bacterium]
MRVRTARAADLAAMNEIYNNEVASGTSTFDTEPRNGERGREWFDSHGDDAYPILVAESDSEIVGWASLTPWSERGAYARTVEGSLFVRATHRRRGIGHALHEAIVERARTAGHGVLIARVESGNVASRELLLSSGFSSVGVMHRVGKKFDRLLDVELFEMALD